MSSVWRTWACQMPAETPIGPAMEAIGSCVPDEILSGDGIDSLLLRTRHLPVSALDEMFLFESRLDDLQTCCDLSLCVFPKSRFGQHLVEWGRREGATSPESSLSWYLSEVSRPESFLSRWLMTAILEYDMVDSSMYSPGLYIEAHERQQDAHPLVHSTRKREKLGNPGVLTAAICAAVGWEEDIAERRVVESLFEALPMDAECSHAGAFPSRKPRSLRLIFSIPFDDCAAFLADICWGGKESIDRFQRIVSETSTMISHVSLACDVTAAGLSRRMGLELFLNKTWGTTNAQDWLPFLDYVHRNGLGRPGKIGALKRWPRQQLIFCGNEVVSFFSGINHFKLVFFDESVQVKSYMGAKLFSTSVAAGTAT